MPAPSKQVRIRPETHRDALRIAALAAMLEGRDLQPQRGGAAPRRSLTLTIQEAIRAHRRRLEARADRHLPAGWRDELRRRLDALHGREPARARDDAARSTGPPPTARPTVRRIAP